MNLGLSIKYGCQLMGKTQKQLAEYLNKAPATITQYVAGKIDPSIKTVELIAEFFDVPVSMLIERGEVK